MNRILVGAERFSMKDGAIYDRNPLLERLRRSFQGGVRRHADQRSVHIPHLADVSGQRNVPEVAGQAIRSADRPADERCCREVVAPRNQLRAGLTDPAESDDREAQWFSG